MGIGVSVAFLYLHRSSSRSRSRNRNWAVETHHYAVLSHHDLLCCRIRHIKKSLLSLVPISKVMISHGFEIRNSQIKVHFFREGNTKCSISNISDNVLLFRRVEYG